MCRNDTNGTAHKKKKIEAIFRRGNLKMKVKCITVIYKQVVISAIISGAEPNVKLVCNSS